MLLRTADIVVAVSDAVGRHALAAGVSAARVVVVPNGVDAAAFLDVDGSPVRRRHGLTDAIVVGFCGSLKPWHGVDLLVDCVPLLPEQARLLIVGDGPQRTALLDRARVLGIADRIVVAGAVPYTAVPGHLAAMDVAVAPYSPSDDFYFSPLKVVEYLAAGLPVVASSLGALRDLAGVVDLIPPGDLSALAHAVTALIEDPTRRRALGERGRALAGTRTWDAVARRLEAILGATRTPA